MITLLMPFATALALSLAFVPVCRWLGRRHGCVAHPAFDRWHGRTVPLLGGVAIFAAVIVGLLILPGAPGPSVLVGCATLLFVLGLVDDVRNLNATTKLIVQFAVAGTFVFLDAGAHWTGWPVVDAVLTMLWVVGITNAFNLIDNMDGLCAGVALIAGLAWLGILGTAEPVAAAFADAWYLALVLGAVTGFLVFNRRPASIFMGDAGSLFLGASIAGLTLGPGAASGQTLSLAVAAPLLVLIVPLLDTGLVTFTRLLNARPVVDGGRDHTSHRLVASGLSERQALAVLWALGAASGAVGWVVATQDAAWRIPMASACVIAATLLATYLAHVDLPDAFGGGGDRSRAMPAPGREASGEAGRGAEVLLDFCLIAGAYYAAYRLRFDGSTFQVNYEYLLRSLPIVVVCQLVALWMAGAYRMSWRRFGFAETVALGQGAAGGTITAQFIILYLYRFAGYSRLVFIYDGVLLLLALVATRVSLRLAGGYLHGRPRAGRRIVFYGADESDRAVFREFLARSRERYHVVGFVDDDGAGWRRAPDGSLPGVRRRLLTLIRAGQVDAVAIGTGQAVPALIEELRPVCEMHDVRFFSVGVAPVDFRSTAGGEVAHRTVVTHNLRDLAGRGRRPHELPARRKRPGGVAE